jgi:hypothetical protein
MNSVQCQAHIKCDFTVPCRCVGQAVHIACPDDKFLLPLNSEDVLSRRPWTRVMWENKRAGAACHVPTQDLTHKKIGWSFLLCFKFRSQAGKPIYLYGTGRLCVQSQHLKMLRSVYISSLVYNTHQFDSRVSAPIFSIVWIHMDATEHIVLLPNFENLN